MKLNNIKQTFLASAALLSTISMSAADRFVNFKQGDLLLNANNREKSTWTPTTARE